MTIFLWLILAQAGLNPPISYLGCWFQGNCIVTGVTNQTQVIVHTKGR